VEDRKLTETEIMFGALDRIVREEMKKKPSKRDEALIDECIAEMAKLKNVRSGYTEEEIAVIVEQLQEKAAEKSRGTSGKPKRVRRLATVICAACLIMGCGIACVAWNPFSAVKEWICNITEIHSGVVEENENITYIHYGELINYSNVVDLLENEHLDIYYPKLLPNDVCIKRIEANVFGENEWIKFYFNSSDIEYIVQLNTPININPPEYETIKTDITTFYLTLQNNRYIARGYIESNLYRIECNDYQDILLIIENLNKG